MFDSRRRQAVLAVLVRQRFALAIALVAVLASSGTAAAVSYLVLGGVNSAGATTTIKSGVNGSVLQVTNTNAAGGTSARGLLITVPAGRAPLAVNLTAGKATNLDADKLDGIDSSAFVRGSHVTEIGNRLVLADGQVNITLLTLPGLGRIEGNCYAGFAETQITWRNTTSNVIDYWTNKDSGQRLYPLLAPAGALYGIADYQTNPGPQNGDTLVLGVGNSPGPRTTATITLALFRTAARSACGVQAMATVWSTP